ncbi:M36 family metallopeptidase [Parasediminibacterium sp. JCM 36343]|uniref:M36 family metallopeptidase n=1 Tax=Parasediminibacterium sp. JCM 36343 TaxID=3374279 RepID=UPI00397C1A12
MKYLIVSALFTTFFCYPSFGQLNNKAAIEKVLSAGTNAKGLKSIGTNEYIVSNSYTDEQLGLQHVYLQQTYKAMIVYNTRQSLVFKNNFLQYSSGKFIADIAAKAPSSTPTILAADAITKVAAYLGLPAATNLTEITNTFTTDKKIVYSPGGIAKDNIKTELVWASNDAGKTVHLAWNVQLSPLNTSDAWHIRIDATSGQIINKGNYTVYEKVDTKLGNKVRQATEDIICNDAVVDIKVNKKTFAPPPPTTTTAFYNVIPFPSESPFITSPTLETDPWTKAGTGNNATTYGWHFDGSKNYTNTYGNNVHAYDDSLNKDAPGRSDTSTTASPALSFNFVPDFTKQPFTGNNRKFAVSNLFYWNNIMHDISYQYGFTESAGNFQNTNTINGVKRGGIGGDYVYAEAQDGSGIGNANFSTNPDGQISRMQMYLFQPTVVTNANVTIKAPAAIAGNYAYAESVFSANNQLFKKGAVSGTVVFFNDNATGTAHLACGIPVNNIKGKIALLYRGTCNFTVKIKAAQTAGAIAAIVVNSVSGSPFSMGGTDNTITIPAVMVSDVNGATIAGQLTNGQTVTATLNVPGIGLDGDIDNVVVCHEYTHGISNRLTGGPSTTSCLDNAEQGGEGWSDFVGLMVTTNWNTATLTDGAKNRYVGGYLLNPTAADSGGFRQYPYTTNMKANPHTYADLKTSGEVHYIGEVWCATLWDMAWGIIQQEGTINTNIYDAASGMGGNVKALQLVMTGMKLQPCSPGFLDARDAILAADSILYNNAHKCTIWKAFARRGMGYSADQVSADSCGDEIVAYDVPPCTLPLTLVDFTASAANNKVLVKWSTANEINTKEFIAEFSNDNSAWSTFAAVSAKNTTGVNEYAAYHFQPVNGNNYYRLKMIDKDGSFTYSKVATLKFAGKAGFSIYPNPVKATLTAELFKTKAESATITVTDMAGRVLYAQQTALQAGNNSLFINTAKLTKGTYLIVVSGAEKEVRQFMKE